jgi:DNA polymerase
VGLSAVQFDETEEKLPLAPHTRTGNLIEEIEKPFKKTTCFYKTNIVKCVPLKGEKIRYPIASEMEKCYPNFEDELNYFKPEIVFLLGKQVASFVYKKLDLGTVTFSDTFAYSSKKVGKTLFVPVHHPSFILVYKRKFIREYINGIREILLHLNENALINKKAIFVEKNSAVSTCIGVY